MPEFSDGMDRPCGTFSRTYRSVMQVMQKHGYIGDLEIIDDHRAGKVVVDLVGCL